MKLKIYMKQHKLCFAKRFWISIKQSHWFKKKKENNSNNKKGPLERVFVVVFTLKITFPSENCFKYFKSVFRIKW